MMKKISTTSVGMRCSLPFRSVLQSCARILLCVLIFGLGGCRHTTQPGETAAEGQRRHLRNLSLDKQQLMSDIDRAVLMDEPSGLTKQKP